MRGHAPAPLTVHPPRRCWWGGSMAEAGAHSVGSCRSPELLGRHAQRSIQAEVDSLPEISHGSFTDAAAILLLEGTYCQHGASLDTCECGGGGHEGGNAISRVCKSLDR